MSFRYSVCFFLLMLMAAGCQDAGGEGPPTQRDLIASLGRQSGLIAYLGVDGNVYTVNQSGGNLSAITTDAYIPTNEDDEESFSLYVQAAWSHDGKKLAYSHLTGTLNSPESMSIYSTEIDDGKPVGLFSSGSKRPTYLYWSPDNENISFISSTASGLLSLETVQSNSSQIEPLEVGQPLYWVWNPQGDRLFVHMTDQEGANRLALITVRDEIVEEVLDVDPGVFQSPDWSPDGSHLMFIAENDDGSNELVLADHTGQVKDRLSDLGTASAGFSWSPDGEKMAFINTEISDTPGIIGKLTVKSLEDEPVTLFTSEEDVVAFFWSPNSKKIAYFVPTSLRQAEDTSDDQDGQQILGLFLYVLDVNRGETDQILLFQPTSSFWNLVRFFDQYEHSTTIWAPDSKNIVVASLVENQSSQVVVVNASGRLPPRMIAAGTMAYWSWE